MLLLPSQANTIKSSSFVILCSVKSGLPKISQVMSSFHFSQPFTYMSPLAPQLQVLHFA